MLSPSDLLATPVLNAFQNVALAIIIERLIFTQTWTARCTFHNLSSHNWNHFTTHPFYCIHKQKQPRVLRNNSKKRKCVVPPWNESVTSAHKWKTSNRAATCLHRWIMTQTKIIQLRQINQIFLTHKIPTMLLLPTVAQTFFSFTAYQEVGVSPGCRHQTARVRLRK